MVGGGRERLYVMVPMIGTRSDPVVAPLGRLMSMRMHQSFSTYFRSILHEIIAGSTPEAQLSGGMMDHNCSIGRISFLSTER